MIRSALRTKRFLMLAAVLATPFAPATSWAQGTPEQQRACAPDAMRLCMSTIPDVGRTTACMKSHVGELSPACRSMFVAATGGGSAPARTARRPEPMAPKSHVATREDRRAAASRRDGEPAPVRQAKVPPRHPRVEARAEPRDDLGDRGYEQPAYPRDDEQADIPYAPAAPGAAVLGGAMPGMMAGGSIPAGAYPAMAGARAAIVSSCRAGLIDPYTCQSLPGLGTGEE